MKTTLVALVAITIALSCAFAQQSRFEQMVIDSRATTPVAQKALGTFAGLVNASNYRVMGFDSPEEVGRATLGSPLPNYMIRLDDLQKQSPQGDPVQLLRPLREALFPVEVDGRVKSSITVAARDQNWEATSFGAPNRILAVTAARGRLAREQGLSNATIAQIDIPALHVVFVGAVSNNILLLVPVVDYPQFGLTKGTVVRASEILPRLVEAARAHSGDPT